MQYCRYARVRHNRAVWLKEKNKKEEVLNYEYERILCKKDY